MLLGIEGIPGETGILGVLGTGIGMNSSFPMEFHLGPVA